MKWISVAVCLAAGLIVLLSSAAAAGTSSSAMTINAWKQKWESAFGAERGEAYRAGTGDWTEVSLPDNPPPPMPAEAKAVVVELELPAVGDYDGIYIKRMYGQRVEIAIGDRVVYEQDRDYPYEINRILLPLDAVSSGKTMRIEATALNERAGLAAAVTVGDYSVLKKAEIQADLYDIFLGSALIFVAFIMLVSAVFLSRELRSNWLSLSCMIMGLGIVLNTYDPFLYMYFPQYGQAIHNSFDVGLQMFLPSLVYFFENMFGPGYRGIIRKLRILQTWYSVFCIACLTVDVLSDYRVNDFYFFVSVTAVGVMMVVNFLAIVGFTVYYALKGSREALILSMGIGLLALLGGGELIWFFIQSETYDLKLWKFGVLGFACSLIVLLCRKMSNAHNQMILYSKELEAYSQKLQRSEKIDIISQLAASVAHEVRNPLQVSRGFLQLLGERSNDQRERGYIQLAIEELDRASGIISDYLSFAKPQLDEMRVLRIDVELKEVEAMMTPFISAQGGRIEMSVPAGLAVNGNAGKLKQVFINLMKNSIEAASGNGCIKVWAYRNEGSVYIHLQDNGEGMDEEMLARIGEPYLTNKSKGTGLGLMASFQIIELMGGELQFKSAVGVGTEAIICLPSA